MNETTANIHKYGKQESVTVKVDGDKVSIAQYTYYLVGIMEWLQNEADKLYLDFGQGIYISESELVLALGRIAFS